MNFLRTAILGVPLLLVERAHAQSGPNPGLLPDPDALYDLLNSIALIFFNVLMIVSVIMIMFAGFLYATAAGNDQQITKAKKTLLYAVVGIVIALIAWSVPQILEAFIASA